MSQEYEKVTRLGAQILPRRHQHDLLPSSNIHNDKCCNLSENWTKSQFCNLVTLCIKDQSTKINRKYEDYSKFESLMQPSMKFKDPAQAFQTIRSKRNKQCSLQLFAVAGQGDRYCVSTFAGFLHQTSVEKATWCNQPTSQPTNQLLLWYNFNLILSWPHLRNHCRVRQWGKCQSRNLSVESASNEGRSGYSRPLCPGGAPRGCDKGELSQEPEEFDRGKIVFGFLENYLPGQIGPLLRILWEGHVHWCSQTGPEKEASFNFQLLKE